MEMTHSASKSLTFEEILTNPSLERYHKAAHFFMENENTIFFPDKFMASLKSMVRRDLQKLAVEKPYLSLSKVVATMLEGMNENMSADMIKEITAFILDKWENRTVLNAFTRQEIAEIG
jgi:hypothetical protein